jgi:hypothetical protein
MTYQRGFLSVALILASALAGTGILRAAAQKPVYLTALVGTWNCTYTSPKGKSTSTITFTAANDLWLTSTEQDSAYADRPAHQGAGLFGYDPKKQQYIGMGGSTIPGDWGVGVAKAAPTATTITFAGGYPPDPTHDKTTYNVNGSTITSTDTWTEKGKSMTGHGSCTKQ